MRRVLIIALLLVIPAQGFGAGKLKDWCGKNGFGDLGNNLGWGWKVFTRSYLDELNAIGNGRGDETTAKIVERVRAEEIELEARIAYNDIKEPEAGRLRGELRRRLGADPKVRAAVANLLLYKLSDMRFGSNPISDLETLRALQAKPSDVLRDGPSSTIVGLARDFLVQPGHVLAEPGLIDPALVQLAKPETPPDKVMDSVRRQLGNRSPLDGVIDAMVGLDPKKLLEDDVAAHGKEEHGKERTWMSTGHDYYGSSYQSFKVYKQALGLKDGDKVVDLGAGPFRAGVYFGAMEPKMEVVGYELFQTRVDAGNQVVKRMGIGDRARIFQKDLSKPNLNLEAANGYILMNPFPKDTALNIMTDLKRVATETRKPFRILIFDAAYDTHLVAKTQPWLKEIKGQSRGESRYGFTLFEVDPSKL